MGNGESYLMLLRTKKGTGKLTTFAFMFPVKNTGKTKAIVRVIDKFLESFIVLICSNVFIFLVISPVEIQMGRGSRAGEGKHPGSWSMITGRSETSAADSVRAIKAVAAGRNRHGTAVIHLRST